jgi:cytochrome c-type biogenesis protein
VNGDPAIQDQSAPLSPEHSSQQAVERRWAALASLALPALLAAAAVAVLVFLRGSIESAIAGLVSVLPVGYAFSAGVVASVNPCGFLLLPSYVLYQLGARETGFYERSASQRTMKALALGSVATLGFVVVFALTGGIIATGGVWLNTVFPHARAVIGAGIAGLGLWLLITGKTIGIVAASRVAVTPRRNLGNAFLFGIAYAISSLSCALPIFLVVVGSALSSRDWTDALSQFVGYALGMGSVFIAVTVVAALLRQAVPAKLKGMVLLIHRLSALLLVAVGLYLIYDWASQTLLL